MSKPTKKPAIEPNVKGSTWAAIYQLGERMRQERIGDRQRAAEELARKKSATGPTVAILKLIDSFIAENKDDHEALKAIEVFLLECDQYVRKETMCGHRERFEGIDVPFTDTKNLEKAYEAVKKYGFSLPENTDLCWAAGRIGDETFKARSKHSRHHSD